MLTAANRLVQGQAFVSETLAEPQKSVADLYSTTRCNDSNGSSLFATAVSLTHLYGLAKPIVLWAVLRSQC